MITDNLFSSIAQELPEELETLLAQGKSFRLKRIMSRGQNTEPGQWYDQAEDEWVILLSGTAELIFENDDRVVNLKPGDYLLIPAHKRHRVNWTDPQQASVWLALYFERGN